MALADADSDGSEGGAEDGGGGRGRQRGELRIAGQLGENGGGERANADARFSPSQPSSLFSLPARGGSSCASPGMVAARHFLAPTAASPSLCRLHREDARSRWRALGSAWGNSSAGAHRARERGETDREEIDLTGRPHRFFNKIFAD